MICNIQKKAECAWSLETKIVFTFLLTGIYKMLDYIYAGIIVFFLILILVIAKVEDGEDMDYIEKEEEEK